MTSFVFWNQRSITETTRRSPSFVQKKDSVTQISHVIVTKNWMRRSGFPPNPYRFPFREILQNLKLPNCGGAIKVLYCDIHEYPSTSFNEFYHKSLVVSIWPRRCVVF